MRRLIVGLALLFAALAILVAAGSASASYDASGLAHYWNGNDCDTTCQGIF